MDKLRALEYFVAAADSGSFAAAARLLNVSVPAVHKLVRALEEQLGVALFERSTRGLSLTASGASYLDSCRPLLEELMSLDEALSRSVKAASGVVVVGAPSQLARHVLLPTLPRFHARYPEMQVDLRVVGRPADPDAAAVDVFLLHGWPESQDLVHRRLGHARSLIAATPEYWARRGLPQHPDDLAAHSCLLLRNPAGILLDLWDFVRGTERVAVKVGGWLSSNDREVVLDAVLAGEGVGRFNLLSTLDVLRSGRLVPALADWEVQGGPPLNLLYRPHLRRTAGVRLFIDFVETLVHSFEADIGDSPLRVGVERPSWHRLGTARASSVLRWRG